MFGEQKKGDSLILKDWSHQRVTIHFLQPWHMLVTLTSLPDIEHPFYSQIDLVWIINFVVTLIFFSFSFFFFFYCSGFCHTLKWISHGFTCIPHPNPSHLPLHPIPLGLPSAPGPSTCLMHPAWTGDLFHPR